MAQFEQEVRPIFEKRCFECHGPDKQKGGLRLDLKSSALEGGESGEPAVVPGKSAESQLIKFVTSKDPDDAMPPKGERLGAGANRRHRALDRQRRPLAFHRRSAPANDCRRRPRKG